MKFVSAYTLLVISTFILSVVALHLAVSYSQFTPFLMLQLFSIGWNFVLIGFGLGFMILGIASILSWLQLYLLISGHIDPHLSQDGFFKAINTLLTLFLNKSV